MWIVGPHSVVAAANFRDDRRYSGQQSVEKKILALITKSKAIGIGGGKLKPAMNQLGARIADCR
jgi:hypothetical protein